MTMTGGRAIAILIVIFAATLALAIQHSGLPSLLGG